MRRRNLLFIVTVTFFILSSFENRHLNSHNSNRSVYKAEKAEISRRIPSGETAVYNQKFNSIIKKYRFNGNVLVAKGGEVIFKKSQGYANLKTKEPLNENTTFQLASVSKQFTAMAIMILHEQGKLQYEDLVIKHIPDFPYRNITIKNLLSHTSGLPNYIYLIEKYWQKSKPIRNEDVLTLFKSHRLPLFFKPGSRFNYSNTGYVFLALLVERISGHSYSEFLKTNIFNRLGMNSTFVYDRKIIKTISDMALSYKIGRRYISPINNDIKDDIYGDKGVYSTIDDLYKWDKALYENILVKETTISEAYEATTLDNNKTRDYGYGWRIKNDKGIKIIYHNGWWHGYKTSITRFIEDKNTIILLNNTNSHIQGIIEEIKKVLYPREA